MVSTIRPEKCNDVEVFAHAVCGHPDMGRSARTCRCADVRRPGPIVSAFMIEDATQSSHSDDGVRVSERGEDIVWWATWVGLILAIVGLVDGLSMALKKRLATCPDGTYFPDDATDINC
jgi:hypothetical protein